MNPLSSERRRRSPDAVERPGTQRGSSRNLDANAIEVVEAVSIMYLQRTMQRSEPMQSAVAKWGNSLALRLPQTIARDAHLVEGTPVDLRVEGENLIVTAARTRYDLAELLKGIRAENRHGETDWGGPRGEETW
jgi:antitoxin MazE